MRCTARACIWWCLRPPGTPTDICSWLSEGFHAEAPAVEGRHNTKPSSSATVKARGEDTNMGLKECTIS
jgi:hypothetical protein